MANLNSTVGIIFHATDKASAVTGRLAGDLKTLGEEGGDSAKRVDDLAKSTDRLADKRGSIISLSDAMKALAASMVFREFVNANVEAEKFERAMTLLKGSSAAAGQEFQYLSGVAKTLGLNVFDAADSYIQLTAATKSTALEGEQTRKIFEAVATAMSSLGKSSNDTNGALLAISQMVSKGTVSMEELRGQLGERLPGAFALAAQSMGLTTKELDDLVSSGKLTAEEFLPKFAAAIKNTFGGVKFVDGYAAAMNRLQNAVSDAFLVIGKSGAFDVLIKGVEGGTASIVGAVAGFRLLGEIVGTVAGALATRSFSGLGDAIDESLAKAANSTRAARDALLGYNEETKKAPPAAAAAAREVDKLADETAKNAKAQKAAEDATKKASESSKEAAKALAEQAKEALRAKEAAERMALELEKLASNERIKTMEFKAQIDVARIQADAEKVTAAFASINVGIESTGDVLKGLFGMFDKLGSMDSSAYYAVFDQISKENQLREKSFDLQKQLTEAQIENMRAQTDRMRSGDALIKIDGAGLKPHLEAFMWEILRTIQTRVNRDGLQMLLGVNP